MFDVMLNFDSVVDSFFNAFLTGFYYSIRFLIGFINTGYFTDAFWVYFITQVILVIIITIVVIKNKNYEILLTIFLCLAVPLLAVFAIIGLMPNKTKTESSEYKKPLKPLKPLM